MVPRVKVLRLAHDNRTSGHLGITRTVARLRQAPVFWREMQRQAEEWCQKCHKCGSKKSPPRPLKAPLQQYLVGAPMERLAIDLTGRFPRTRTGNYSIMSVADYFTKWVEAFPIPDQTAQTVAKVLVEQVITRFGAPLEIHTDQGREFEAELFQGTCKLLGVQKTRTTPFYPQSDGMVERFNRTVKTMLSLFVHENQDDWDEHLPYVMMAYRSSQHDSTKFTPNMLMLRSAASVGPGESASYKPGQPVWMYTPSKKVGRTPKLQCWWDGPFVVTQKIDDVTFRVQESPLAKAKVVHSNRLKPYLGDAEVDWWRRVAQNLPKGGPPPTQDQEVTLPPSPSTDTNREDPPAGVGSQFAKEGPLPVKTGKGTLPEATAPAAQKRTGQRGRRIRYGIGRARRGTGLFTTIGAGSWESHPRWPEDNPTKPLLPTNNQMLFFFFPLQDGPGPDSLPAL
ncbi:uncharacterized protein LOC119731418 [Patiria miniata]|uniref:Integrase catalytic domain-containing protein n=1 Tax=Patiria miniata TaxID=46514 RepID=A0A914AAW8_PATMI|nr:uncharacterized protein LOC119731418 [Patiria miniata]